LAATNPGEVDRQLRQARGYRDAIEIEQRKLREKKIELEGRLSALDKRGIRKELEVAREQSGLALRRQHRVQLEADALRLLVDTLEPAESDAKKAFLPPVLRCIQPFLDLLFPGAELMLAEDTLEITEIVREGRAEPYETLSIGTREQLSILVRLAFAVYLRERGYPAAVILDDALVHADLGRFKRMQAALCKAAETVQILILACRPDDWQRSGVTILHLRELTAAPSASV